MATLRDTRNRIVSVRNTSKITQAMRMVAAAKLRRAQDAITAARPFAQQVQAILRNLASAETEFVHPYFETRAEVKNVALIVVSSDRGLCGAFNTNLLRAATQRIAELRLQNPETIITVIPVGRRATSASQKWAVEIQQSYPDVFLKLDFSTAESIAEIVSNGFLMGGVDRVELLFNEFVSVIKQDVRTMQLLPIVADTTVVEKAPVIDYIFEPSKGEILDTLLPMYINLQVWRSLLDSNAAEQAARMMAMENATNNARDLITSLQLLYNRERQAAITKEMLEIVGGAEALNN
jgi:F-type H+-transporting ATPase subunit gamma